MKLHSALLVVLLTLMSIPVLPQTKTDRAQVEWGPDLTSKKDGDLRSVFGHTDEHIYMLIDLKFETYVQKMDLNNRRIYQKVLPMKIDKDDHSMERILVFGDRILAFTTFFDKKTKSNDLYLRIFNEQDMSPEGHLQRIANIDVDSKRAKGGFDVNISPDKKYILVSQQLPFEKEGNERFKLKVYDSEMNPSWEEDVNLPYLDSEFAISSKRVANDGSVLIIGKKFAGKQEARELEKEGKSTYEYHLLTYDRDGRVPQEHVLQVPDIFLQDLSINVGEEGDILAGGFYGLKDTHAIHGVFFMRLDRKNKKIVHSSFKEFDKDLITGYMTGQEQERSTKQSDKKGKDIELANYELRDIIRRTDGGVVMVGEQFRYYVTYDVVVDAKGRNTTRTVYNFVYNDILVVNVDPDGDIEWAAKVPKRQHSTNDGGRYSSYAMVVKEDKIYLMFNDNGKNLFLTPGQKVEPFRLTGKEALITLATVDANGVVHREALLAPDRRDAITQPKACRQITDDRMFMYASQRKNYRFGSVIFQ